MSGGKLKFKTSILSLIAIVLLFVIACSVAKDYNFRQMYADHNQLIHDIENRQEKPFLKVHLKNGGVFIMQDNWVFDSTGMVVIGEGQMYDFTRQEALTKKMEIHADTVALYETNRKIASNKGDRVTSMAILTALDLILGLVCISQPKACFGSCPTFYLNTNQNNALPNAESFSNAISPSLAYCDIDDLQKTAKGEEKLMMTMLNEALETHVVKQADIIAVPKHKNQSVYLSSDEEFYTASLAGKLISATGPEGNIKAEIVQKDGIERFSLADQAALVTKETIYLTFDGQDITNPGLAITFRQTMMTTYALYSALGYMGDEVGDIFAKMETSKEINTNMKSMFYKALGGIEVYSKQDNNHWKYEGEVYETGPIARNHELVNLQNAKLKDGKWHIKLVLNKGLWRLDCVNMVNVDKKVKGVIISPTEITKNNIEKATFNGSKYKGDEFIISMPGDRFVYEYTIPACSDDNDYQIFLSADGYYLEWMRASWLKDKNLKELYRITHNPVEWLNDETTNYKKYEAEMEQQFWNSRWTQKYKSYEEL